MTPRATLRPITALAIVMAALSGCTRDTIDPAPLDGPIAALAPGMHGVNVTVRDPAQQPVGGILVTVTNVATGDYFIEFTGPAGSADFELPDGSYLVHARNLADAGPLLNFPKPLVLAPLPPNAGLINTTPTQGANNLGVLYDPTAQNGWVPLDPNSYSRLSASPALVLAGPSASHQINLQFAPGALLDCTFYDANGAPLALPQTKNVFIILPHGSGPLPPLPSFAAGLNLPRGILLGVTTAPAGATSCALGGFSIGAGFTAVVETSAFDVAGDKQQVLVGSVTPSGQGTASVQLFAEPRRSNIGYLLDPFGDGLSREDLGLTTFGWEAAGTTPTDDFVTVTRFQGAGDYLINVTYTAPAPGDITVRARCDENGCVRTAVEPVSMAGAVSVTGAVFVNNDRVSGILQFRLRLPGVTTLNFKMLGARPPRSDFSPDTGFQPATKSGTGNTWVIPGD
jgi:hypothetical protein